MAVKNRVNAIVRTAIDSSTFTGSYQAINGAAGLSDPCFLIRIINDSDQDIDISYDGVNDHDFLRAGETLPLSFQTNSRPSNYVALLAQGTIVYVSGNVGTGNVYLVGYFNPQG